jgi:hypothetical protein
MVEAVDANAGLGELKPALSEDIRRITLLAELGVLDTDPEPAFDALPPR